MTITQEAIEAAYNAFQRPNRMLVNTSDGALMGRLEAALEAVEPFLEKQVRESITGASTEIHQLLIGDGDEELWVRCTCGWSDPRFCPVSVDTEDLLGKAFEAWYWPHAIKEHIKLEEAEGLRS